MALDKQNVAANRGTWIKDTAGELISISTSTTLADAGLTITGDVVAVTVHVPIGTVNYNPAGAADATNFVLPVTYTIYGNDVIDLAEIFAATATDVSFVVHTLVATDGSSQ